MLGKCQGCGWPVFDPRLKTADERLVLVCQKCGTVCLHKEGEPDEWVGLTPELDRGVHELEQTLDLIEQVFETANVPADFAGVRLALTVLKHEVRRMNVDLVSRTDNALGVIEARRGAVEQLRADALTGALQEELDSYGPDTK